MRAVRLDRPTLPERREEVRVSNLSVGDAAVDLRLRRAGSTVGVDVLDRRGAVEILVRL